MLTDAEVIYVHVQTQAGSRRPTNSLASHVLIHAMLAIHVVGTLTWQTFVHLRHFLLMVLLWEEGSFKEASAEVMLVLVA